MARRRYGVGGSSATWLVTAPALFALLFGSCTYTQGSDEATPVPNSAAPTTTLLADFAATSDFGSVRTGGARRVVGHAAPAVEVGFFFAEGETPSTALFVFPPIEARPECILRASLDVRVDGDVPLAAYAARQAVALADNDGALPFEVLVDNRPSGEFSIEGGLASADVTNLMRTWLSGSFPSNRATVDPAGPFVLAVQPSSATSNATVQVQMSESGDRAAPRLRLSTIC